MSANGSSPGWETEAANKDYGDEITPVLPAHHGWRYWLPCRMRVRLPRVWRRRTDT